MSSGAKSYVLNRKTDWKNGGILKNLSFKDDNLVFESKDGENAVYISKPFDSMQNSTIWHRLRLNVSKSSSSSIRIRAYASDTNEIFLPSSKENKKIRVNINEYMQDESIDIGRKIDVFDFIGAKLFDKPEDILLYDLKGRYLWICIDFTNYDLTPIVVESLKLEFPKVTFVDYLPEIYKKDEEKNTFLARFLGIFQSIYVDLEEKIDYVSLNFDADKAKKEFLSWIGSWLSVKDAEIWGEKRLRKLIKNSVKIYKMKGTKKSISKIVEEYLSIEPIIVEQFDVKDNMYYHCNKEIVENLYGDNGYVFTVMIPQAHIKDAETYTELLRVINSVKPIDSICNLVVLNEQIYLDSHCYLGINSFITKNENLVLNKKRDANNLVIQD